jgi:hypothetical protein
MQILEKGIVQPARDPCPFPDTLIQPHTELPGKLPQPKPVEYPKKQGKGWHRGQEEAKGSVTIRTHAELRKRQNAAGSPIIRRRIDVLKLADGQFTCLRNTWLAIQPSCQSEQNRDPQLSHVEHLRLYAPS